MCKRAIFSPIIIILWFNQGILAYNVALVEYLYDEKVFPSLSSLDLANRNAKIYDEIITSIKKEHGELDLAVFPEATLVSEPLDTPSGRLGMTFVPKPEKNVTPCNSSENNFAGFFKMLSCAANKHRTYLVVNLKEKDSSDGKMKFYNTDVVFDRNGKVVARYRKYNLYLEPDTNRPEEPELVSFDTDFGKTFGIFTCFDIIFKSPAVEQVRKGVNNFIFPTLWIPELPFLTTNQVQQMWAQGNDVTLLASGAAFPRYGSGGLGIYLGNHGTLAKVVTPRTDNYYLYANVPDEKEFEPKCSVEVDEKIAQEMDKYTLFAEDLTEYSYKKLNLKESSTITEKLCQNNFCCDFVIETKRDDIDNNKSRKHYEYFLVNRNGLRSYGNNTYRNSLQTCGLIACPGPSIEHCGQRLPKYNDISWPVTFKKLSISAVFTKPEENMQFPNSLLTDFSPIPPACTSWLSEVDEQKSTVKRTFSTKTPITKLLTFAIFGRNYDMDIN